MSMRRLGIPTFDSQVRRVKPCGTDGAATGCGRQGGTKIMLSWGGGRGGVAFSLLGEIDGPGEWTERPDLPRIDFPSFFLRAATRSILNRYYSG